MGVYIFRCKHAPYVKVGHHLVTPRRPNAYYRIAGRGFESVVHPSELDGKLSAYDVDLVAWFPVLTRDVERRIHASHPDRVGEFHREEHLPSILATCDALSDRTSISDSEKRKAFAWGRRQARRQAKRKKKK